MKRRDLERMLKSTGWHRVRHGANHDIWSDGKHFEPAPRHKEINEQLANNIVRKIQRINGGK